MLGRSAGLFERQYHLVASFGQTGGLIQGATVRLAGVPVGRVGEIRLPEAGGTKVRVELLIARRVQDRIRADSVARIETLGLLGDKIIDVSLGSPEAAVLQAGAELRDRGAVRHGPADPAGRGAPAQPGRPLGGAPGGPRAGHGEPGRQRPRGDACGPSGAWRPRSSGARGARTGSSTTGSSAPRWPTRARPCGRSGETVRRIDRALADPATAGLASEAQRTLAEARAAAERVNRILREVEEGRGSSTRSCTTRGAC